MVQQHQYKCKVENNTVVTLARLDVLPEDGLVMTETCWGFNEF